jgi:hypothetical protein
MVLDAVLRNMLISLCAGSLVLFSCGPSPLEKAREAENTGNYRAALGLYAQALQEAALSRKLPDKTEASVVSADAWHRTLTEYLNRLRDPTKEPEDNFYTALEGIVRCTSNVTNENVAVDGETTAVADTGHMYRLWHTAFFPERVPMDRGQKTLAERAQEAGFSFVRMKSGRNYTYEGSIVDRGTGTATGFFLYGDSEVLVPVRPGTHLLFVKSAKQFLSGEIWESSRSVLPITVPDTSVVLSFTMRTRVRRGP